MPREPELGCVHNRPKFPRQHYSRTHETSGFSFTDSVHRYALQPIIAYVCILMHAAYIREAELAQTKAIGNQNRSYPDTKLHIAGSGDENGIEALREMMFSRFASLRSPT